MLKLTLLKSESRQTFGPLKFNHPQLNKRSRGSLRLLVLNLAIAFSCFNLNQSLRAQEVLEGRVTRLFDGDSLILRSQDDAGKAVWHNVRLAGIDAPEKGQPYDQESTDTLRALIRQDAPRHLRDRVQILVTDHDTRYDRVVGIIYNSAGLNVNLAMIELGAAWYGRPYQRFLPREWRVPFREAEAWARQTKLGLFQERRPEQPWKYRSRIEKQKKQQQSNQSNCKTFL